VNAVGQVSLKSLLRAKEQLVLAAVLVDAEVAVHKLHDALQKSRSVPQHWPKEALWYHESANAFLGASNPVHVSGYLKFLPQDLFTSYTEIVRYQRL